MLLCLGWSISRTSLDGEPFLSEFKLIIASQGMSGAVLEVSNMLHGLCCVTPLKCTLQYGVFKCNKELDCCSA